MDIRYKILEDREKRIDLIANKLKKTNNLVLTIKANICGNNKNIKEANIVIEYFKSKVFNEFSVISYEKILSYDGNFYLVELAEKDFKDVKIKLIELENCDLGRFVDLDLFQEFNQKNTKSISRRDLGLPTRKCIICGESYNICLREKKHTLDEVLEKTISSIKKAFIEILISNTTQSLLAEVTAHPKFGLVTKVNSGKHKDMDYNTFIDSIDVLKPYFYDFAYVGFEVNILDKNSFSKLRKIGLEAEIALLERTKGVNTYKGVIFLLGLLLPSIVNTIYNGKEYKEIQETIKFMCKDILNDFNNVGDKNKNNLTYGEKIYLEYGITGIRGVAESGIDIGFRLAKHFDLTQNENDLVINILLHSMALLDDTVILHKQDFEVLKFIKTRSKEIIAIGGMDTNIGKRSIDFFTDECIKLNISPGGSADIVSVVLILMQVRNDFFKENYVLH